MSTPRKNRPASQPSSADAPAGESSGLTFDSPLAESSAPVAVQSTAHKPASVEIEASAINPGIDCPFTDGCKGHVRIHRDMTSTVLDVETNRMVQRRQQQYICDRCKTIAKGTKQIGGTATGRPRMFNRETGKFE